MVTKPHNPEKDIRQLANAILRFSEMPVSGHGKYTSDTQYLATVVAPLAQRMKNRYKSRWKPVGDRRIKIDSGKIIAPITTAQKRKK